MKTGSAKSIHSPREWIFDLNPGCTTLESDCRTTTEHCSCHQVTFGDKHNLWSWAVTGRQTGDVHLQSVLGAGWKNSNPTLPSRPSFTPRPPPPPLPGSERHSGPFVRGAAQTRARAHAHTRAAELRLSAQRRPRRLLAAPLPKSSLSELRGWIRRPAETLPGAAVQV
mgnify:CR=1 FL=1